MPLYDYKCRACGVIFEVRQSFSDPLLTTHETCGGSLERLISAPALQFKGSGFYITDYARGGDSPSSKSGSNSEGKGGEKKKGGKNDSAAPAASTSSESSSGSGSSSKSSSSNSSGDSSNAGSSKKDK